MPKSPDEVLTAIGNALVNDGYIKKFELGDQSMRKKGVVSKYRVLHLALNDGPNLFIVSHHDPEQAILNLTGKACPRTLVDLAKKYRRLNIEREQVLTVQAAVRKMVGHFRNYSSGNRT